MHANRRCPSCKAGGRCPSRQAKWRCSRRRDPQAVWNPTCCNKLLQLIQQHDDVVVCAHLINMHDRKHNADMKPKKLGPANFHLLGLESGVLPPAFFCPTGMDN